MKIKNLVLLTLIPFLFCQCEKVEDKNLSNISMRTFENIDALMTEINLYATMELDEITHYENRLNFNSFGKIADQIYYPIVENDTNISINSLNAIVDRYPNFLKTYTIMGEVFFDTKYADSPFRYVMNTDRMFAIDTLVYKVFEDGLAYCSIKNYDMLSIISDSTFQSLESNEFITVMKSTGQKTRLSLPYFRRETSGKERIEASFHYHDIVSIPSMNGTYTRGMYSEIAKAWRKTLFWFRVKRHIAVNYNVNYSACECCNACTVNSASNYVDFKYKYEKHTQYAFIIHSKDHRIYQLSGSIGIPAVTINF